jgi:predicted nucleic acid-binding protein
MSTEQGATYLDSSFIVRYLTNDPPEMAKQAAAVIDSEQPLIVSELILAESAYVLASVYQIPRADVVDALMAFLQRANIRLAHLTKPVALDALQLCKNSKRISFADALLWAEVFSSTNQQVYTFDKRFPAVGIKMLGG